MKRCNLLLALVFAGLLCSVQSLVAQESILFRPLKYDNPYRNIDTDYVPISERDNVMPWFVVATRENTTTTATPGGYEVMNTLQYGHRYYVVDEHGAYIRVAKDDRRRDFNLSSRAVDLGWVHKNDMLLWNIALINPETNIALKAMILNTTRALGSDLDYRRIQAYKDPERTIPTKYEARVYEIFYVYRYAERENSMLLGRGPYFSERDIDSEGFYGNLIGWVDVDRVVEWDHRVAIEPNAQPDAVRERHQHNIRTKIFNAHQAGQEDKWAIEYLNGRLAADAEIAWDDDIYDSGGQFERKPGYWRRFPVIGDYGQEVYKVMVMGELRGELGVIAEEDDITVRQKLNELINQIRNINVVFVIDGTRSMGPFYESAINSVQRIVDIFEEVGQDEHSSKMLRFGYVVYRDYLERDRLVETRQLTTNAQMIIDQLRLIEARDIHDIYPHEAVYYGLKTALNQVFTDPHQTNILIHIGDAGNHYRDDPSQVPQSEIVRLLVENFCYYIAYQAHHTRNHVAYTDFPRQIREIMSQASGRLYDQWRMRLGEDIIGERPFLRDVDRNITRVENGPPMVLISSNRGEEMDIRYLENEITRAIEEIDRWTDLVLEQARVMLEGGGGINVVAGESEGMYASSFAPGVYNLLLRMDIDEDLLRNYYTQNVQLVVEGYTGRNHVNLNRPLFTPVLLLQRMEFMRILLNIQDLRTSSSESGDRRDLLYNSWIELLRRHIGVKPDAYYDEITLAEAASMVFGVPMRTSMLQQIQLKDIHDRSIFPDTDLNRYLRNIEFKSRQLERIANTQNYPYSFMSNDILYYWIDIDYLP